MYSGNEGNTTFQEVCVHVLTPIPFETELTVSFTVLDGSAGMYILYNTCHKGLSIAILISQTLQTTHYLYRQSPLLVLLQNALHLN